LCPSEYSVSTVRRLVSPRGIVLSWTSFRVQSFGSVAVSPAWVRRSRSTVGPCLSCAVFPRRASADRGSSDPFHPLFAFDGPPESSSVVPSRPAGTGPLLSWALAPFSTCRGRRSTDCARAARTGVPPSGFGDPPDGLLPSIPGRFSFTPAALVGFSCRSLAFRRSFRALPPGHAHLPFCPPIFPTLRSGRPGWPRFLGAFPAGSALPRMCV